MEESPPTTQPASGTGITRLKGGIRHPGGAAPPINLAIPVVIPFPFPQPDDRKGNPAGGSSTFSTFNTFAVFGYPSKVLKTLEK